MDYVRIHDIQIFENAILDENKRLSPKHPSVVDVKYGPAAATYAAVITLRCRAELSYSTSVGRSECFTRSK